MANLDPKTQALSMNTKAEGRKALSGINDPQAGQIFREQPVELYSTVFINPSTAITNQSFFGQNNLDTQWQTKNFPNNQTTGFKVYAIRMTDTLQFTVSNALRTTQYQKYFRENSQLVIENENVIIYSTPVHQLYKEDYVTNANTTGTTAAFIGVDYKFNNYMRLETPILFAAGEAPTFTLVVAKGLTTAAWTANVGPVLSATGNSGLTTADEGFTIRLELYATKAYVSQGA